MLHVIVLSISSGQQLNYVGTTEYCLTLSQSMPRFSEVHVWERDHAASPEAHNTVRTVRSCYAHPGDRLQPAGGCGSGFREKRGR